MKIRSVLSPASRNNNGGRAGRSARPIAALGILLATLLPACSTVESRIKERPHAFASLTPHQQVLVRSGVITKGMPTDAVYIAWGRPDVVTTGERNGKRAETWFYHGTRSTTGFALAGGFGCGSFIGLGAAFPVTIHEDILRAWAAFEAGRVVAWEKARW